MEVCGINYHSNIKQFTIYPPGGSLAPAGWKKRHSDPVNKIKYTKKKRNIQTTAVYIQSCQ